MRDLPWQPYLVGKEKRHREDILRAHKAELDSLCSTMLRELKPGDDEYDTAVKTHTTCRAILEWKRQGLWKVRVARLNGFTSVTQTTPATQSQELNVSHSSATYRCAVAHR